MKLRQILNVYVETDSEFVGPFETGEKAQEYINDRDDHGYDVHNWCIVSSDIVNLNIKNKSTLKILK